MFVNKIWSSKTQLPYTFYSLPFCRPEVVEPQKENIGQIILGDRIQNSDYEVRSNSPQHPCRISVMMLYHSRVLTFS
jgi:transmembrane 9 superfamily protein 2/4